MPKPMSKSQRRRARAQAKKVTDEKKNPVITVECGFCGVTRDVDLEAEEDALCVHCYRPMEPVEADA